MEPVTDREREVVAAVLGCPVTISTDIDALVSEIERLHCYDQRLQRGFTADHLSRVVADLAVGIVREIREPLGMRLTLARLGRGLLAIGPYTDRSVTGDDAAIVLGGLRIAGSRLPSYLLYRARYAIVDSEYALRAAASLLSAAGLPYEDARFQQVAVSSDPVAAGSAEPLHLGSFDKIEARYAHEAEFLAAVSEGDEGRALAALQRMASAQLPPAYLSTPYLGQTILRILTRVGAQLGGLPPVTLDAISQSYAQRLHRAAHSPSAKATQDQAAMVAEFCRHVRRHRQRPYSKLVRQVIDEIELHLSHHVSPSELARRLHVSESHLARTFKAETGHTIAEHVAQVRCERAAQLLTATKQPVRDIAAYVGYLDANYFVKVFRTVYDTTPTEFRRRHSL